MALAHINRIEIRVGYGTWLQLYGLFGPLQGSGGVEKRKAYGTPIVLYGVVGALYKVVVVGMLEF